MTHPKIEAFVVEHRHREPKNSEETGPQTKAAKAFPSSMISHV